MFVIKPIDKEDTYPLRIEILRDGKAENYHFVGDEKEASIHLGVFVADTCVGIVALIPNTHKSFPNSSGYQLRGMAVDKSYRKQGIGKLLVEASYKAVVEEKCEILWCNAREIAVDFYKKMGFKIRGDKFQIPTVGAHYLVFINLSY